MHKRIKITVESIEDGFSGFIKLKNSLIISFGVTITEMIKDLMLDIKLVNEDQI